MERRGQAGPRLSPPLVVDDVQMSSLIRAHVEPRPRGVPDLDLFLLLLLVIAAASDPHGGRDGDQGEQGATQGTGAHTEFGLSSMGSCGPVPGAVRLVGAEQEL